MSMTKSQRLANYLEMIAGRPDEIEATLQHVARGLADTEGASLQAEGASASMQEGMQGALELAHGGAELNPQMYAQTEAIINEQLRPAVDIVNGTFKVTHPLWMHLTKNEEIRKCIESVIPFIGRVEMPDGSTPYVGTGFVVGSGLLMTNRHVAEVFATGLGSKRLEFRPGASAEINFVRELGRPGGEQLHVRRVLLIHPYWDMALLEVEGLASDKFLKLSLKDARQLEGTEICVVGYPAFDPRNPADVQKKLFNGTYGIKRLQPGKLKGAVRTGSFGKIVDAAGHDCSTLGGNSGSAVFDTSTGEVLALHFGGAYHQVNYGVPSLAMSTDSRVVDAGVRFAGSPSGGPNSWGSWWAMADSRADERAEDDDPPAAALSPTPPSAGQSDSTTTATVVGAGGIQIQVPLIITLQLGQSLSADALTATPRGKTVDSTEAMREPEHDSNYSRRSGYDSTFLGKSAHMLVPMPVPKNPEVVAVGTSGETELHYQNFTVVMHAKRRLALFTASNVTKEQRLRKPDPNQSYSRKDLAGLGPNDQEKWFIDPRLDEKYQLPDAFFTKDGGAFDKGHIVRREDVAWGKTYAALKRANGDTYHVTNCSPQVADFNRSNLGELNWGDLENHVLTSAALERLCVFAGPVLASDDPTFVGKGTGNVTLRARIPQQFWKLIVAASDEGLTAFGFVLEQDLKNTDLEFAAAQFSPVMDRLTAIQKLAGIRFDDAIVNADQFDSERGAELMLAGIRRREQ